MKHYIDLDARVDSDNVQEQQFLIERLFFGLHKAIVQECGDTAAQQSVFACTFPQMDTEQGSVGPVLRVFSDDLSALERFLRHSAVHRFAIGLSPVVATTPAASGYTTCARDRAADAYSPAALRRMQKRAAAAGREAPPRINGPKVKPMAKLELRSESTGQTFAFGIKQLPAEAPAAGTFNAYGLSSTATVPTF